MFKYVIKQDLMPPWYLDPNTGPFKEDISLTLEEKALLLKWAEDGFLKKKNRRLWAKKSAKALADYIIPLPEKIAVPAEGPAIYKRFLIRTNFKEDKWIKNIKFIVKPKVVHHYLVYVMDPSFSTMSRFFDHYDKAVNLLHLINFDPDSSSYNDVQAIHKEAGIRLPRGSKLILELHYEPTGQKTMDDKTQIHINFHKKKPKFEIITYVYGSKKINIPPYEPNYKIEGSFKVNKTMPLVLLGSHMHLRGKASSIVVIDPNGTKKRIFGIDPFLPAFQSLYRLKKPYIVRKGSTIKCLNWFDNSQTNPVNPNPSKYVRFGWGAKDEMATCFFQFLTPVDQNKKYIFFKSGRADQE